MLMSGAWHLTVPVSRVLSVSTRRGLGPIFRPRVQLWPLVCTAADPASAAYPLPTQPPQCHALLKPHYCDLTLAPIF